MGNRGGAIHNDERRIVRQYASRRWIACVLEFRGRYRTVMSPNRYTELFFLDEAVALAAGHRPCAECRHERFNAFKEAWTRATDPHSQSFLYADAMDLELHPTRIGPHREKVTYRAPLDSLPDGCFVQFAADAYLVWGDHVLRWSPEGYVAKQPRSNDPSAVVLTPQPIVRCLSHGYRPEIHSSARTR